jgi:nitrogen fixation/metabolism regulation signal transduction histidine kinase
VPQEIISITINSEFDGYANQIKYYDEVLTQSARNYAFTGDAKWKIIYKDTVPLLDNVIKSALEKGDTDDKTIFAGIDGANLKLIDLEEKSIILVDTGDRQQAVDILESKEYWQNKNIYKKGLEQYYAKRKTGFNDILITATKDISDIIKDLQADAGSIKFSIIIMLSIVILGSILLYLLIRKYIINPVNDIKKAAEIVAQGNLTERVKVQSHDELGQLSVSFNQMIDSLKDAQENIEKKVEQRTQELKKANNFMVDREVKMIELKKDLQQKNEILNKLLKQP